MIVCDTNCMPEVHQKLKARFDDQVQRRSMLDVEVPEHAIVEQLGAVHQELLMLGNPEARALNLLFDLFDRVGVVDLDADCFATHGLLNADMIAIAALDHKLEGPEFLDERTWAKLA
eukprot:CAMPEP_0113823306 /NCGR_PEP_ID=MMETSP0328-20130328/2676_1 /TAXON_ID=39455 /ORGANISM="Alexandrium minutum" /LENGTH=116 /DNA_ID=CAMNT_0000791245 /DNA_START=256 /DNA_END=607 /DNA_ORIENTATION=- /assembly_acc=CAM_ASM_000350